MHRATIAMSLEGDQPWVEFEMESPIVIEDADNDAKKRVNKYKVIATILFVSSVVCLILLICAILLKFGCQSKVADSKEHRRNAVIKFFHVSDIHADLHYNSNTSSCSRCRELFNLTSKNASHEAPYGRAGCDSPPALVESTLNFMKHLSDGNNNRIDFILVSGDQVPHDIDQEKGNLTGFERALSNINATSHRIAEAFPDIPILPSFGNNDLPGNYVLPKDSLFYEKVLEIWQPLIMCSKCKSQVTTVEEIKKTFLTGGYYKVEIKGTRLTLLQINANYWYGYCIEKNPGSRTLAIADAQINWLSEQLQEAQNSGNKVIISGHIPPGIDTHFSEAFWLQNYTSIYIEFVTKKYKDVVIGQLYGHIHRDDMRLQMLNDKVGVTDDYTSFLLIAPGITPIYKNNPGFRVVSYDTKKRMLTDYQQYYMDLLLSTLNKSPIWLFDYSFSDKYMKHLPEDKRVITGKLMAEIVGNFINQANENRHWQIYIQHRQVNYQPDPYSRFLLYCAAKHVTKKAFDDCFKQYPVTGGSATCKKESILCE